jgi:hypothetical protein
MAWLRERMMLLESTSFFSVGWSQLCLLALFHEPILAHFVPEVFWGILFSGISCVLLTWPWALMGSLFKNSAIILFEDLWHPKLSIRSAPAPISSAIPGRRHQ